jgi:uncharacterized protein YbjT (DUF2867 family)
MKDQLVTVFGGDGFVGRYVVQALLRGGARVRVASRKPKAGWFLKAQANLGQLTRVAADVTRPDTVAAAVAGADAVVNLVAIMGGDMAGVNVRGAANVAAAARDAEVRALVHISAIGADSDGISAYARSKGDGEAAVRAAYPGAAILRPSIVFGREDAFINRFAGLIRMLPIVPVIGAETKFQPVFVGDVARAVAACVAGSGIGGAGAGQTLELGGPQVLTMLELNQWIAKASGRSKLFVPVPMPIAGIGATLTGWLPGAPITRDQWLSLQKDNIVSDGKDGLAAMNITPTPLDAAARGWMVQYRKHGRFGAAA